MSAQRRCLIALAGLASLGSCLILSQDVSATEHRVIRKPGVIFVVGGVGGFDVVGRSAQWALPQAGVPHEVRDFVWTHGWGRVLKDLQDIRYLLQKAEELASEIREVKAADPERPVYLVGKSGGAAVVLAAAERLPPETLERIILLSPAVSTTYDLRPALRATRKQIVSFHSKHDRLVLGWGTREFGTADRVYGPSAGLHGFTTPDNPSEEDRLLLQRLVQIPWMPRMVWEGHLGTHLGTSLPVFLYKEVAPWLR